MNKIKDLQGFLPSISSETRVAVSASTGKQNNIVTIHERQAIDFDEHKLKYLKEKHEMKLKLIQIEAEMKEKKKVMQLSQILHQCMNLK